MVIRLTSTYVIFCYWHWRL